MRRLFPDPLDPVDPGDVYGDPPRTGPGGRPGVRLNMIASVDGATTVARVSGGLGGGADHDLFGLLRSLADVVLVAAGTARAEGYGPSRVPVAVAGDRDVDLAVALDGREIPGTTPLRLRSVCEQDGFLFLRYRTGPGR
jgi:hypothetical protein